MVKHSEIGVKGEQIAADFLLNKGYIIICRNWRSGSKEVDIIAYKDDIVAVIEVKTRSVASKVFPEETVNKRKQQFLKTAATSFMDAYPQYLHVRYDIISILLENDHVREIVHFEEAFY